MSEYKSLRKYKIGFFVLCLVVTGVIIWVVYLTQCNFRFDPDGSAGVLVTALGVMVTALVGWQVYNAVENTKMLSRLADLEKQLNYEIKVSDRRQQEIFDIAEAHRLEWEATLSNDLAHKYSCHQRALLLYLRSNIDLNYGPLQSKLPYLKGLLYKISNSEEDDKILFARQMVGFNETFEAILDVISQREENLRELRKKIIDLMNERMRLFSEYEGKLASIEENQI